MIVCAMVLIMVGGLGSTRLRILRTARMRSRSAQALGVIRPMLNMMCTRMNLFGEGLAGVSRTAIVRLRHEVQFGFRRVFLAHDASTNKDMASLNSL
ncbi:MAG: hypothetical protein A2W79_03270 [Pseudomonadales bacterium RIFCSPLOWO2_12_60_38]|uniref:Uncharacterized protein n=2 Tax=Pseudomonas TaxID=286 RepID=A0A4Q0HRF3_PSEAZ|nr:hypothetical protein U771_04760 [Pseudomonas sp. TKP]ATN08874.1 hypothetical protein CRN80_04035 [Pseudomonas sp. FDAARGOS_380]KRC94618.1 hypothetical protein ASE33_28280 [Pseudomonas sp. Root9]KRP52898.1 hypothetical protein TU77_17100 [Pseudomonas synxantha]KRP63689.1 hypothetical protein TU80_30145 [Pseudomonas veronii]KRP84202.1 hypothetical protein TX25_29350 [Pseudomonas lactis]KTC26712.1 hypothetical protein AO239_28325 [Pseudomonas sp. ICMP 19500]OEC46895.1 hypothetical protein A7